MIRSIIGSSLQLRFLVIILAAVLMVVGVGQVAKMPVDVLPEFSPPYVEIRTEALGILCPGSGAIDHPGDGAGFAQWSALA